MSPLPTTGLYHKPLMLFDRSGPTCLWKCFLLSAWIQKPFLLKRHFFLKNDRQEEGGGLYYSFAWLLNWVISLHLHSEGSVTAVGQQGSKMKDRQLVLPLVTVPPDTGSHTWQPSQSICEKLSGCTLNQSVGHLKPRPISAVSQCWAVGRRCLKKLLSWLPGSYHWQTTAAQ